MRRAAFAVLSLICAVESALARDTLPHACTIPPQFAASLPPSAAARHATAESERTALSNQIASFESQCASVPEKTPAYDTCVAINGAVEANIAAYLRLLEDNQAALNAEVGDVRGGAAARVAALDRKIADTRAKLAADGRRISGIEAAAKEWEDASEAARLETQKIAIGVFADTAVDFGLKAVADRRQIEIALDEKQMANVQRAIGDIALPMGKKLSKADLDRLFELDRYFTVQGPRIGLRLIENRTDVSVLEALKVLSGVLDLVDLKNAWDGPEQREQIYRRYLTTLKTVIKSPQLKYLLNQWDLNLSLAYLFKTDVEAEERINQLSQLGTDALEGIASLSALHKAQVDERAAVKRLLAAPDVVNASGCPF
jgi:hypothetical protein